MGFRVRGSHYARDVPLDLYLIYTGENPTCKGVYTLGVYIKGQVIRTCMCDQ